MPAHICYRPRLSASQGIWAGKTPPRFLLGPTLSSHGPTPHPSTHCITGTSARCEPLHAPSRSVVCGVLCLICAIITACPSRQYTCCFVRHEVRPPFNAPMNTQDAMLWLRAHPPRTPARAGSASPRTVHPRMHPHQSLPRSPIIARARRGHHLANPKRSHPPKPTQQRRYAGHSSHLVFSSAVSLRKQSAMPVPAAQGHCAPPSHVASRHST